MPLIQRTIEEDEGQVDEVVKVIINKTKQKMGATARV